MGRWGLRQMATLCVMVWVMAACGPALPANPLETPSAAEPTLIVRTPATSPGAATRAAAVQLQPASATQEASRPGHPLPVSSPTPFYYTVRAGDTLAAIAQRFDSSVSAIRAANAGLPPDALYAGQVLLIPPPATRTTPVRLRPTHTPPPLEAAVPTCYRTPAAEVICLGTLRNPGNAALTNLVVQVTLRGEDPAAVFQRTISLPQQVLLPDHTTGYSTVFASIPDVYAPDVVVLSADWIAQGANQPVSLDVEMSGFVQEEGLLRVEGLLTHANPYPVREVMLMALAYDEAGQLTGLRVERPDLVLMPGESYPVEMLVTPLVAGTVRVELLAEAGLTAGLAAATDTQVASPAADR